MAGITVRFIDVDGAPRLIEGAEEGESLMSVARRNGVAGIQADCGGACSCATCHVYVAEAWLDEVGPPDDVEEAMLDMVEDVRQPNSRLSCQIPIRPALDGLEVTVAPNPMA